MNGKYILLFMVMANILVLIFASQGQIMHQEYNPVTNTIIGFLMNQADIQTAYDYKFEGGANPSLNVTFGNATNSMVNRDSSTVSLGGLLGFIDVIALIWSFIAILTPLPFIGFMITLGLPMVIIFIVAVPLAVLWIISLAEFIRGGVL